MLTPLLLTKALIQRVSITPDDADCLDYIAACFAASEVGVEWINQGEVKNLFIHYGDQGPLFVFLGHVDVVPPGSVEEWDTPPFSAIEKNGFLYGRGSADMKSAVAAMVCAMLNFIQQTNNKPAFRLGLLLTSDEEGVAEHGIKHVMRVLESRATKIDYCLVGEPSCENILGDTIKIGRRGSLSGQLTIFGKQGHIAYPHLAINPIHQSLPALLELTQTQWDEGDPHFQPTALQFSNIHSGTGVGNVIPSTLHATFNFRFAFGISVETLKNRFEAILHKHQLHYEIVWSLGGLPFLTHAGWLLECAQQAVQAVTGCVPELTTHGGTSDGRFVALTGAEVIEFGVVNKTIHQINECVKIDDIHLLAEIYLCILKKFNEHEYACKK
jgi:succinyl-diaminopimelate desuccinylase